MLRTLLLVGSLFWAACDSTGGPSADGGFNPEELLAAFGEQTLGGGTIRIGSGLSSEEYRATSQFLGEVWRPDNSLQVVLTVIDAEGRLSGERVRFFIPEAESLDALRDQVLEMTFSITEGAGTLAVGTGQIYLTRAESRRFEGVLLGTTHASIFSDGGVTYAAAFLAVPSR